MHSPHAPYFEALRAREFARLDRAGEVYLDHTGAGLYGVSQVDAHAALLRGAVLGNPHSDSPASRRSTNALASAAARTLAFLDADPDEYELAFTANASGAIRLVGESFPFRAGGELLLTADNHNSVNGLRELARRGGAAVRYVPLQADLRPDDPGPPPRPVAAPRLFAYPAQSNFSGARHPLEWVERARAAGYRVLLDAAAYLPTARLSLRAVPADFVALSFYKLFGYPTGLGALVTRRDALAELRRPWFAGGTVDFVSTLIGSHRMRPGAAGFEDGTPSFLAAGAVEAGFDLLDQVGMARLGEHLRHLTGRLLRGLGDLRDGRDRPRVAIYGPRDTRDRGPTVAFNLLDRRGSVVDYRIVEAAAGEAGISIRGGCFCNPGAAERAFGFDRDSSARCLRPDRPFDLDRLKACLGGRPVGALRASFGMASVDRDVDRLLDLMRDLSRGSARPLARAAG